MHEDQLMTLSDAVTTQAVTLATADAYRALRVLAVMLIPLTLCSFTPVTPPSPPSRSPE